MSTNEIEILKLALNGGTLGLNFVIIGMLFVLANRWLAKIVQAVTVLAASYADLAARIDKLTKDTVHRKDPR